MMKKLITFSLLAIGLMAYFANATEIPPGPVSGDWYASGNPYNINGEIYVSVGTSLFIHEGVEVIFQGHYKFIVEGTLEAVGTVQDSILFTPADTSVGWHSIRFLNSNDACLLDFCILEYGKAEGGIEDPDACGGAIFCDNGSSPTITNCTIRNNWAFYKGGGICLFWDSNPLIENCAIIYNSCHTASSGVMVDFESYPTLKNCVIAYNISSTGRGGFQANYHSEGIIENCLIVNNEGTAGGGLTFYDSPFDVINCTIANNHASSQGGGIYLQNSPQPTVVNSIIWGNTAPNGPQVFIYSGTGFEVTYSNIQGGWTGTGNINADPLFVSGYYLSQPPCQTALSPCVDAGNPSSPMIIGTTRTDGVLDEGIVDMGYHYEDGIIPIEITLTPANPPIIIPETGGSFDFNIAVTNNTPDPQTTDIWTEVILSEVGSFQDILFLDYLLPGGAAPSRERSLEVPAIAPAGEYQYCAYVGEYPWIVWDDDSFIFTKEGTDGDWLTALPYWNGYGESFDEKSMLPIELPSAYLLHSAHPNPFNPTTAISYQLQAASYVELVVYDVMGREVARLVDGFRSAGMYETAFNASELASGVYFARLTAGNFQQTQKLLLVK